MILDPGQANFSLFAPNGWGKSVFAKALITGGLSQATRTSTYPSECNYWLRCLQPETVSLIPQGLERRFSARTVLDYFSLSLVIAGRSAFRVRDEAASIVHKLGLSVEEDQPVWTLSGGEEQIIFLIGQLLQIPESLRHRHLMVCDDPYLMLDDTRVRYFQQAMQSSAAYKSSHFLLLFPRKLPSHDATDLHLQVPDYPRQVGDFFDLLRSSLEPVRNQVSIVAWSGTQIQLGNGRSLGIHDGSWRQSVVNIIVGHNGSGKSLFTSLIAQGGKSGRWIRSFSRRPQLEGQVWVDGTALSATGSSSLLRVGIVPQQVHRISGTVDQYIDHLTSRTSELNALKTSLDQCLKHNLSFGMKKLRYTCLCALILYLTGSNIIVIDEPDMGLDTRSVAVVIELALLLIAKRVLVVIITHAPELYGEGCNAISFGTAQSDIA